MPGNPFGIAFLLSDLMELDREILSQKLNAYLNGESARADLYQWALKTAVEEDIANLSHRDFLAAQLVEDLVNLKNNNPGRATSDGLLRYYQKCLNGSEDFDPEKRKQFLPPLPEDTLSSGLPAGRIVTEKRQSFLLTKTYVILFAVCSLLIHAASIVLPEFFYLEKQSFLALTGDSLPFILYSIALLIPFRWAVRGSWFYVFFFIFMLGLFYYFYASVTLVSQLSLSPVFILVILPFSVIPALLAVVLLLQKKW